MSSGPARPTDRSTHSQPLPILPRPPMPSPHAGLRRVAWAARLLAGGLPSVEPAPVGTAVRSAGAPWSAARRASRPPLRFGVNRAGCRRPLALSGAPEGGVDISTPPHRERPPWVGRPLRLVLPPGRMEGQVARSLPSALGARATACLADQAGRAPAPSRRPAHSSAGPPHPLPPSCSSAGGLDASPHPALSIRHLLQPSWPCRGYGPVRRCSRWMVGGATPRLTGPRCRGSSALLCGPEVQRGASLRESLRVDAPQRDCSTACSAASRHPSLAR